MFGEKEYEEVRDNLLRKGKAEEALAKFEEVIDAEPGNKWAWNGKGIAFHDLVRFDDAIKAFSKSIRIDPLFTYPFYNRALSFERLRRFNEAITSYDQAIKIKPNFAPPWNGKGNVLKSLGKNVEAIIAYEKAIEINPNSAYPWNGKGNVLYILEKNQDAVKNYKKAIENDPQYSTPWNGIGNALKALGRNQEAIQAYKTYLTLDKEENYWTKRAKRIISELEELVQFEFLSPISQAIDDIKELLLLKEKNITHYTSLTVGKFLMFANEKKKTSGVWASEATFTNDPSEGKALFEFLEKDLKLGFSLDTTQETYTKKPFLTCFVPEEQDDDLTMWRFYGKEGKEDACGCSITLDKDLFSHALSSFFSDKIKETSKDKSENRTASNPDDLFEFYQVAYFDQKKKKFHLPQGTQKDAKELNDHLKALKTALKNFKDGNPSEQNIQTLRKQLAEVMYLFKNAHYQYEREVRLLLDNIALDSLGIQKINTNMTPPRVYLELCPLVDSITSVTIGPKAEQAQQWAAALHYSFESMDKTHIKVKVSSLPYQ